MDNMRMKIRADYVMRVNLGVFFLYIVFACVGNFLIGSKVLIRRDRHVRQCSSF